PVNPRFLAIDVTAPGPTLSINWAVMVFTELANAFFRVNIFPEYLPSEFLGHQGSGFPYFPASMQYWLSGRESQGERRNWSMAAAYTNGLKVDPTCLAP